MASVLLRPGVNLEMTPTLNEAGYSASSLIRYKNNLAQKIGGWIKFYGFAVGGIPRGMHAWQDLNEADHLAVGSTTILGVITSSVLSTITPQIKTTNFAPKFTTLIGSPNVTVDDSNIATVTTFDTIEFKTPVSVGGIILSGVYPINLVLGVTTYRIVAASNATATVANGGAVPVFGTVSGSSTVTVTLNDHGLSVGGAIVFPLSTTVGGVTISGTYTATAIGSVNAFDIAVAGVASSTTSASMNSGSAELVYYIAIGPAAAGTGYGIGTYGSGGYGTGTSNSAQTGTPITAVDWTHDNWGSTLLSCPEGGGVYQWAPNSGFQTARLVSGAPLFNGGIFVASPAQILIAWGSTETHEIGIDRDPLTYAWSDQIDFEFWTAGVVNPSTGNFSQAGSARIPTGSKIVAGVQAPQQSLLWTDLDLWSVKYIGQPDVGVVFGQTKIGSSCGAIGSHAVGQLGGGVYWMGKSNFFRLTGNGVEPIPCTVWDAVFQDLDMDNAYKIRACPNTPFNEMMWEYPSASGGTGENDSYAKINVIEGGGLVWDIGPLKRSAWIDQSVLGNPIGASPTGIIYQHEEGENDDGQPISWSFKTGYWSIAEANDIAFVDLVIPDGKYGTYNGSQTASVQITLYSVMFPGDTERAYGPYTVTQTTQYINTRVRGRQMAMRVSGSDLDSFFRLGRCRFRFAVDGRR